MERGQATLVRRLLPLLRYQPRHYRRALLLTLRLLSPIFQRVP